MLWASRVISRLCLALMLGAGAAIGAESPNFVLTDLDGIEHRVSDVKGKWLVMNFWATWCAPCIHEMPELERFHQAHKDKDGVVWGITFEDIPKSKIKEFLTKLNVTYPIVGYGQEPNTGYGNVRVLPTTFLIDPKGQFYRRYEGPITVAQLESDIRQASSE